MLRDRILLLVFALLATHATAMTDLNSYRWKNRIVSIEAESSDCPTYQRQAALLMAEFTGLLERDLIVLTTFTGSDFRVSLIGKDGGRKLTQKEPVTAAELFALIDAMPMRPAEMTRSKS